MKINMLEENTDYRPKKKKKIHLDSFVKNQVIKASTYIRTYTFHTYRIKTLSMSMARYNIAVNDGAKGRLNMLKFLNNKLHLTRHIRYQLSGNFNEF